MEIHFLVMEKSWKIIVEKEWSPCLKNSRDCQFQRSVFYVQVHRALMIVCLILTAVAFILIFVHVGGYSHVSVH